MRSVLGFVSLLSFGVLAAGVLFVVASGSGLSDASANAIGAGRIDLGSLLIGLALGVLLSALARVSWSELPRRLVHWLLANERSFYRVALAGLFIAVLVFY